MIDLEKVIDDVIFRTDFDADEAIFTHDNISPDAIAGYKKFEELIANDIEVDQCRIKMDESERFAHMFCKSIGLVRLIVYE